MFSVYMETVAVFSDRIAAEQHVDKEYKWSSIDPQIILEVLTSGEK